MYFQTTAAILVTAKIGDTLTFPLELQGLRRVQVTNPEGLIVGNLTVPILDQFRRTQRTIQVSQYVTTPVFLRYNIKAFDGFGRQQLSTVRVVRFVPSTTDFLQINSVMSEKVQFGQSKYVAQYDSNLVHDGKMEAAVVDGKLRMGNGKGYNDNADTTVSLFVNSTLPSFKVALKATYQTEKDYDFLKFGFIAGGKTVHFLTSVNSDSGAQQEGVSGKGVIDQSFLVAASGEVELFVRFVSDYTISEVGATIDSITISS
jgi:hypothetical protein